MIEFTIGLVILVGVIIWTVYNNHDITTNSIFLFVASCMVGGWWILNTIEALL